MMSIIVLSGLLGVTLLALALSRRRVARLNRLLEEGEAQVDAATADGVMCRPSSNTVTQQGRGASNP